GLARPDASGTGRITRAAARARARHPHQNRRNAVRILRRRHAGRPGTGASPADRPDFELIPMNTPDRRTTKYIFITGGVLSSLGKGLAAASIGCLLESHGYKVTMQKFDPYINVDPGTMSPYQHGEVFVTDDGGETDLDLGHYERFTNTVTTK